MSICTEDPELTDHDLFYSPEHLGIECNACFSIKRFNAFERDSSYRTGHKPTCLSCVTSPRMSMAEHSARLGELNFNSEGTKRQRHEDQEEFHKEHERVGRRMHTSVLLLKLQKLVPSLHVKTGNIEGDLALYQTAETPQAKWDGKNFSYLGFVSYANLPEYSQYEFDNKLDIVIRESNRGWRTILLRFIKAGLLTEEQCDREFGHPSGRASLVWYKKLWQYRNERVVAETNQI